MPGVPRTRDRRERSRHARHRSAGQPPRFRRFPCTPALRAVSRRRAALRQAVRPAWGDRRTARLSRPRPRGHSGGVRTGAVPSRPPRNRRLADAVAVAEVGLTDPRADLLPLDRAVMAVRTTHDPELLRAEPRPVREVLARRPAVRRDGIGTYPTQAAPPTRRLHRRPERRPRKGFPPDRVVGG